MSERRSRQRRAPRAGAYQVGPGTLALLAYRLFDGEGELVEESAPDDPQRIVFGYGELGPVLERVLSGLTAGETTSVRLGPDEAFGRRDPEAILEVDRADFPSDIAPGDELEAESAAGEHVALKVLEVLDGVVVVDTNHPLADQTVRLDVTIVDVRPASSEEIAEAEERLAQAGGAPGDGLGRFEVMPPERLIRRAGRGYES